MAVTVKVTERTSNGIGFGSALTLLFICLKLVGIINWSWWWVLSPAWIPITVFGVVALVAAVLICISRR